MTDRKLTITENNIIDATRKLAYCGVFHNFRKNPEVISFSSELANKMFRELTLDNSKKVSMNSKEPFYVERPMPKIEAVVSWLNSSCTGYFVMVDSNVFFQEDSDRAAFIMQYSL